MEDRLHGGCACGAVRYHLEDAPMFVHCCHCRDCQRQTGSAFVINALIETSRVTVLQSAEASLRTSIACHVPAAGEATSANQK